MTEFMTREAFLRPSPRRFAVVQTERGKYRVQSLTELEKARFEQRLTDNDGKIIRSREREIRQALIAACLVDGDGNRLLNDSDVGSEAMASLDGRETSQLWQTCKIHCGFDDGDLEAALKNSSETAGG